MSDFSLLFIPAAVWLVGEEEEEENRKQVNNNTTSPGLGWLAVYSQTVNRVIDWPASCHHATIKRERGSLGREQRSLLVLRARAREAGQVGRRSSWANRIKSSGVPSDLLTEVEEGVIFTQWVDWSTNQDP